MRIIGLTGRARAGKDTVAAMIGERMTDAGLVMRRHGFADTLKVSAARALGFDGPPAELLRHMDDLKVNGTVVTEINGRHGDDVGMVSMSGRKFLQRYGTESHRDLFGADFWVDALLPPTGWRTVNGKAIQVPERFDGIDVLVITDVRFENEARRVRRCGGELWEIVRSDTPTEGAQHVSEAGLPDDLIDRCLLNDGTLDDLRDKVDEGLRGAS